jgi:hypothetical protein
MPAGNNMPGTETRLTDDAIAAVPAAGLTTNLRGPAQPPPGVRWRTRAQLHAR